MITTRNSMSCFFTLFVVINLILKAGLSYGSFITKKAFNSREHSLLDSYHSSLANTMFTASFPVSKQSSLESLQKDSKQRRENRNFFFQFLKNRKMLVKDELLNGATTNLASGFKTINSRGKRSAGSSIRRKMKLMRRACNATPRYDSYCERNIQCLLQRSDECNITITSTGGSKGWRKRGPLQFDTSILAIAGSSKKLKKAFLEISFRVLPRYQHSKISVFLLQQQNNMTKVKRYKDLTVTEGRSNNLEYRTSHSREISKSAKLRFQITSLSLGVNSHVESATDVVDPLKLSSWTLPSNLDLSVLCHTSGKKNMFCKNRVTISQQPQLVLRTFSIRQRENLK